MAVPLKDSIDRKSPERQAAIAKEGQRMIEEETKKATEQQVRVLAPSLIAGRSPLGIVPTTFDECYRLAKLLSQSTLVPKDYQGKDADCCVAIMQGLELGLSPMAALGSIAVINGRASIWGDGALAVVRASGLVESFSETEENEVATCAIKRRGEAAPIVRTFSQEDAKKANLAGKTGPWTQYPRRMRQMRARSWALRDGFADVLKGLYIAEEAQDIPMRDVTPRSAALAVPDDIPDESATVATTVSEAESSQDEMISNVPLYLQRLGEQLAGAADEILFIECWQAHEELVEAGRLPKEAVQVARGLYDEHGKRFA